MGGGWISSMRMSVSTCLGFRAGTERDGSVVGTGSFHKGWRFARSGHPASSLREGPPFCDHFVRVDSSRGPGCGLWATTRDHSHASRTHRVENRRRLVWWQRLQELRDFLWVCRLIAIWWLSVFRVDAHSLWNGREMACHRRHVGRCDRSFIMTCMFR